MLRVKFIVCSIAVSSAAASGCGGPGLPGVPGGGSPTQPTTPTNNRILIMYTLAAPGSSFTYSAPIKCTALTGNCLGSTRPPMSAVVTATTTNVEYDLPAGRYQILIDRFRPDRILGGVLGVSFRPVAIPPTVGLTQRPQASVFMDDAPQSYGRVEIQNCSVGARFTQNAGSMEVSIFANVGTPAVC